MENKTFPITPPPELIKAWSREVNYNEPTFTQVAIKAARWGSDQELEACCEYLSRTVTTFSAGAHLEAQRRSDNLRAARRPKPLSLKKQALDSWDRLKNEAWCEEIDFDLDCIRQALESLPS